MSDRYRIADAPATGDPGTTAETRAPSRDPVRTVLWVLLAVLVVVNVALSLAGRPIFAMVAGIAVMIILGVVVVRHLTGRRP